MDFTQYSADDLRKIIINAGYPEGANIKGKSNLAIFIQEHNIPEPDIFENAVLEDEIMINSEEGYVQQSISIPKPQPVIEYDSAEWNEYILGLLRSDEVDQNGHPLLVGIRRLTRELLGEVIFSGPVSNTYKVISNSPNASCVYEVQILWKNSIRKDDIRTFRACGDCFERNTDDPWGLFASAIAESRAEARAYRKALNLKLVVGEELSKKIVVEKGDSITKNQLTLIKAKIKSLSLKENFWEIVLNKKLNQCTQEDGVELIKIINKYQNNIEEIPEEVKAGE